jgi:hypothetical protein
VIISHNAEFTDALCSENWIVNAGACVVEGEAEELALKAAASANNKIRKSKSAPALGIYIYTYRYIYTFIYICIYIYTHIYIYIGEESVSGAAIGNTNKNKVSEAFPLNPRTLEVLSKKEARLLSRYFYMYFCKYM